MLPYGYLKKSIIAFSIIQALSVSAIHARGMEEKGHSQHQQGMHHEEGGMHHQGDMQHQQYHHNYQGQGSQAHVYVAPQGEEQQQGYQETSAPDNPLYDAESQQMQQQGQ